MFGFNKEELAEKIKFFEEVDDTFEKYGINDSILKHIEETGRIFDSLYNSMPKPPVLGSYITSCLLRLLKEGKIILKKED